ncbi:MAG TPA: TonB-dependent siderophore receptor [Ferrovibrio sp.]|uniref:TonB-dependent receptor n=1 Tax=Ferrovibrio sp. TaxID=1917215 RepID=UPI002B4B031E|nr:TonB-dependent siderophore receptor [Ferrovibrio sp.]HLT76301.1 TonB-dependent siderophore receptor [Ferrovibrio sp.]
MDNSASTQPLVGRLSLHRPVLKRVSPGLLASAVALGAGTLPAAAQQAGEPAATLPPISVEGRQPVDPATDYKIDQSASPKFTAPLLNTPKSVTIIPQALIQEQGATSLKDVLRTTPGISLGSGEGGTAIGDRPFIRGYEARTDLMIDGMRDLGTTSHEPFNLEQVEITKGPGSAYTGRGSTGGSINMVSKTPKAEDFTAASVTLGTDMTKRLTADVNHVQGNAALRLNVLGHDGEVAGRDEVEVQRWGFAPSLTLGLDQPTRVTFSFYHLQTEETPDLGVPFSLITGKPAKVDRDNFYGLVNRDFRETQVDMGTVTIEHDLTDSLTLRNATRYSWSEQDYILTRPSFANVAAELVGTVTRGSRSRNSDTTTLINQTDLTGEFDTGSISHRFVAGLEFSREDIRSRGYAFPSGAAGNDTPADANNPNPHDPSIHGIPGPSGSYTAVRTDNKALYVFDTAKLSEQWEVNLGLRFDNYEASQTGGVRNTTDAVTYQTGLVYKPLPNGSIYVAHGTSVNPAGEGAGQSGGNSDHVGLDNLDPEEARSYELGTKWDLLNQRLSATAAIFRTEKTNVRATDPITNDTALIGESRVDGIEFGLSGKITPAWKVFGGYTYLRSKLVDDGAGMNDGKEFPNIAPHSFSLWTTYDLTPDWTIGGGAFYMGRRYVNADNTRKLDPYWRLDAMVAYQITENVNMQLNVLNLTDETIYDASHVGAFANVAPGRSALLTTNFKF